LHFRTTDIIAGIEPAAFEPLFFAEDLNIKICAALGMGRTLLERHEDAHQMRRRVSIRPQREVPAALRAVIGAEGVEYVEEMVWQHGSGRGDWTIVPNIFTKQVSATGWVSFAADPAGTLRAVEGEVKVSIFGLGRIAERFIISDIEKSFTDAARLTHSILSLPK
jgi:hypothetical protein